MKIKEIKEKLKDCSFNAQPFKKSSGKWGLSGSTSLDRKTELEAWEAWYDYCKDKGVA